jgi:diguanylate cyclase (GGDEF)-like protein
MRKKTGNTGKKRVDRTARRDPHAALRALERAESRVYDARKSGGGQLIADAFRAVVARQRVREMLVLDPKLEIENDARFNERLFAFLRSRRNSRNSFSFAIVDLDFLKEINDKKGHDVGDGALGLLAEKLSRIAKKSKGFAGRFGGDEFKVLVPKGGQKLKADLNVALREMKKSGISFSAGIADSTAVQKAATAQQKVKALNDKADKATYRSKRNGRSRVTVFGKRN